MAWKQVKPFDLSKMGTRYNYCLANCRAAFGIPAKYADAKAAMEASRRAGTLHDISTLPKNVAVPVFLDVTSVYEHVEISDRGTFYSDGKKLSNPMNQKFFGWSETLNDVRVVEFVPDPTPAKTNEQIADEVIAGKWGNGDDRKNRLQAAGYDYATIQNIVNQKMGGKTPAPAPTPTIKVGSKVTLTNWVDYNGTKLRKTRDFYFVNSMNGSRVVLAADKQNGPIYAAVKMSNLKLV